MLRTLRACGFGLALLSVAVSLPELTPTPAVAADATAADRVTVDTGSGYARLLFSFTAPTQVTATVADGVLTIRAPRTVTTSAEALAEQLGSYVSSARRDADGTYRFALTAPIALHSSLQGNRQAIDLVPAAYRGTPPDLPAPPPPPRREPLDVAQLPVLKVRFAEFAGYTRVVFDWPQRIPYNAYPGKGRISLRFEALARPDFSAIEARTPAWVKTAGWRIEGTALVVDIDTDAELTFQHLRNGNSVAVDIFAPAPDASRVEPATAAATPPANTPPRAPAAPPVAGAPTAPAAPAIVASPAEKPAAPTVAAAAPEKPAAPLPTRAELTRDGLALRFPDARGKPVAVFTRGANVWVILDDHAPLEPVSLLAGITALVGKAEATQIDGAAVLRLILTKPLIPSVRESDASLDVVFAAADRAPPSPITLERKGANGLNALAAALPGAVHAIALPDAEAGDNIWVVPARPGRGVLTARRFVDLEALPSAAGLAIVPHADDLGVAVQNETVTISRPRGLSLATLMGVAPQPIVQVQTGAVTPTFLDFARWARSDAPDVYTGIRDLRSAVAKLPVASVNKARLRLAQYLLAQGLAPEAIGEITLMRETDAKLKDDAQLQIMTAAAQYMIGRNADARQSLAKTVFDGNPHAALWRGLTDAALKDWLSARRNLQLAAPVLRSYPDSWQARVQLARAEVGLSMGDLSTANDALDQLPGSMTAREHIEADYQEARLLAAQGHVNEAIARLKALENGTYAPIAARAILSRIELQLAGKKIKQQDAIETLERLRYRWRGDDVELNTLRLLGSVYFAEKQWRDGLEVLRTAALNFPASENAREAQDEMRTAFADLFLNGKADTMEPVQALSLFYDFIELTPIGRDGDEMIRRLSDRLVAIDLLGPAEELLQHQVDQRLEGVGRAVVASQLAAIYLADRKPKEALKVIASSRQTGLPEDLNTRRRLLEARALAAVKDYEPALDLIADEDGAEAAELRADIAWQAGNWSAAGTRTEELLAGSWQSPKPLSDVERLRVLRTAVSYSLAGDAAALARLNERYGTKMAKTADANAFAVVTQNSDGDGVAIRDLVKRLASVQTLQAFMTEFRGRSAPPASVARN